MASLSLHRDIGGEEGIALAEGAHGDVLRGPFADAREVAQAGHGFREIASRIEQMGIGTGGRCEADQRRGTSAGHADIGQGIGGELFRPRESMGESRQVRTPGNF